MKKYFAAAAVAVMVFAFAAFAAELDLDGGVVQAGVDDDLTCTEGAEVTYKTGWINSGPALDIGVNEFVVTFEDGCNGNFADVTVLSGETSGNIGNQRIAQGIKEIANNKVTFTSTTIRAEDVERVAVVVTNTNANAGWTSGPWG